MSERKPVAGQVGWDTAAPGPGPEPSHSMWYWQTGWSEGRRVPGESKAPGEAERAAEPEEEMAALAAGLGLGLGPELALEPVVVAIDPSRRATRPESTTVVGD